MTTDSFEVDLWGYGDLQGIEHEVLADNGEVRSERCWDQQFRGTPLWKRSFDVVVSILLLILLSPLLLALTLLIKCVSPGPVLFVQDRLGARGKRFRMLKFRTMVLDNDTSDHNQYVASLAKSTGPLTKLDSSSKLIPCGGWLRRYSLDELPQLINVLLGQMSIIGPRPDVIELEAYESWQLRRFDVLPGITGLWQVSGKNRLSFEEMLKLDVTYVDNRSFWLDVEICLKTLPVLCGLNSA